jgi:hypothetical protein
MAKVLCVLYPDPVDGYPTTYPRDGLPKLDRYPDGQTLPSPHEKPTAHGCPAETDHDREVPEIDLLSPLTIRGVPLRNRIVMSPCVPLNRPGWQLHEPASCRDQKMPILAVLSGRPVTPFCSRTALRPIGRGHRRRGC